MVGLHLHPVEAAEALVVDVGARGLQAANTDETGTPSVRAIRDQVHGDLRHLGSKD
jgi:hypothetical protein